MKNHQHNSQFWIHDISILFRKDKLTVFFPDNNMSLEEKLNAIVRLSFYISILLFVYNQNYNNIYVFLITMLITYFIYNYADNPGTKKMKEHLHLKSKDSELQPVKICEPTKENPFCNMLLSDYEKNPNVVNDLDVNNKEEMEQVDKLFNNNLYRDVNDIWGNNNSQRQFMPNPIRRNPNDQGAFAKWCYGSSIKHCKEGNGTDCFDNLDTPLNGESRLPMI